MWKVGPLWRSESLRMTPKALSRPWSLLSVFPLPGYNELSSLLLPHIPAICCRPKTTDLGDLGWKPKKSIFHRSVSSGILPQQPKVTNTPRECSSPGEKLAWLFLFSECGAHLQHGLEAGEGGNISERGLLSGVVYGDSPIPCPCACDLYA